LPHITSNDSIDHRIDTNRSGRHDGRRMGCLADGKVRHRDLIVDSHTGRIVDVRSIGKFGYFIYFTLWIGMIEQILLVRR